MMRTPTGLHGSSPILLVALALACACADDTSPLADAGAAPTCASDDACPLDAHCADGACLPGTGNACEGTADCGPGRECRVVTDCGATRCHGNTCEPRACTTSAECEGLWCDDGACQAPPACQDDDDCPTDFACGASQVCAYSPSVPCAGDDDCTAAGTICVRDACVEATACQSSRDCPLELRCIEEVCRDPCDASEDCGTFGRCDVSSGECQNRCVSDATCPSGAICERLACVPAECAGDPDCVAPSGVVECRGEQDGHGRCVEVIFCDPSGGCPTGSACDSATGRCEPLPRCASDRACEGAAFCDDGFCQPSTACGATPCARGRDCVGGVCVPSVCRGDADCPVLTERCIAGACAAPAEPTFVTQVRILTPAGVVRPGSSRRFVAVALDQSGAVVPGVALDFQSATPAIAAIDPTGLATGGRRAGTTLITASVSNGTTTLVSPAVTLTNLGNLAAREVRVSVVGLSAGSALSGAVVEVTGDFGTRSATTGASGIVTFDVPAGARLSVTGGHVGFDFVSVLDVDTRDLVLALPSVTRPSVAAGIRGSVDLSGVRSTGQLSISLNGTSLPSPLITFEPGALFGGDLFTVPIPNPMGGGTLEIPLPAGSTVGVEFAGAQIPLKETYFARASTGVRAAWSIGGRVGLDVLAGGAGGTDLLSAILPYLQRFDHAVRPVIDVVALPTVVDTVDIDGDGDMAEEVPNWQRFPAVSLAPDTAQSLRYHIAVGALPLVSGGRANALITLAGALLPGVGFVPLGVDGVQDASGNVAPFTTRLAPPHAGLEVGEYAVLATAVRLAPGALPSAGASRLLLAPRLPEDVDFADGFLDAPVGSTFSAVTRELALPPGPGADLHRVTFAAADGAWHVFTSTSAQRIAVPLPPAGLVDRTEGARVSVDAIDLVDGASASVVFDPEGGGLHGLDRWVRGFARAELE